MNLLFAEHTHYNSLFKVGCHHLSKAFAKKGHSVTYISHCISPLHPYMLFTPYKKDILQRFRYFFSGGIEEEHSIFSYVPFSLIPIIRNPFTDNKFIAGNHLKFSLPNIARWLKKRGPFDAVFIGDPQFTPLTDMIDAKKFIFRLTDFATEFDKAPDVDHYFINYGIEKCDEIIVTSNPIREELRKKTDKTVHYVPNGADIGHFTSKTTNTPSILKEIPHPRAIYVGAIESWFDIETLRHCVVSLPEVQFVIIGPPRINISDMKQYKNLHFLGAKPYNDIPAFLKSCDIGIIPFKRNALVQGVSPIKLYEYMACGLPVIASSWKELELLKSPANLAHSKEEFADLIQIAINSAVKPDLFINYAKDNSWEKRANTIASIAGIKL